MRDASEPMKDITFFVPCYNEEGNIAGTIDTIVEALQGLSLSYGILVCDDASTDRTCEIVQRQIAAKPEILIQLVENAKNNGLGHNYFQCAFLADSTHYMLINGDNVEPVLQIRDILTHLGEADMVIPYFGERETRTGFRKVVSRTFTLLVNTLSSHSIHYYNGAVLHRTENVRLWSSETRGYGYQTELICRLLHEGRSYVEVSTFNIDRQWGCSKAFSFSNIFAVLISLRHIFFMRIQYGLYRLLARRVGEGDGDKKSILNWLSPRSKRTPNGR